MGHLPEMTHNSVLARLSEGSDSKGLMTELPGWLNRYIELHKSSIEEDGNGGHRVKENVPYFVYSCNGEELCGGIGDRINAMTIVLYLAMCSGRVLLIDSPYPSPLGNFLEPNKIQWNASEPLSVKGIPTLDMMNGGKRNLFVDHSTIGYRLGRCNGLPARHTLRSIWSGQNMKDYFKNISELFPYEVRLPQEELLRWSFWSLFKFNKNVLNRANELRGSAGLTQEQPYIGIHVRTGDKSMGLTDNDPKRFKINGPPEYVRCYQKLRQSLKREYSGYIASDSTEAKQNIGNMDPSVHFMKDGIIFHVDKSMKLNESGALAINDEYDMAYEGSLDTWAELAIMADARCLIMSKSMFSFCAHYIGGSNRCGMYVGDCNDMNINDPVHEYRYEGGKLPFALISRNNSIMNGTSSMGGMPMVLLGRNNDTMKRTSKKVKHIRKAKTQKNATGKARKMKNAVARSNGKKASYSS